jgi:hypothetical protein
VEEIVLETEPGQPSSPAEVEEIVFDAPPVVPMVRRAPALADLMGSDPAEQVCPPRRRWLAVLVVVGVVALLAQVAWYQKDRWMADPEIRPWLEQNCARLGCELPLLSVPTEIEARELIVRAHPDAPDALIVDALVVNRATFAQAYPVIELTFSDVNGRVIAERGFDPAESLAGDLAGAKRFAPATPIHISLEIEDPGDQAVNYRMTFR